MENNEAKTMPDEIKGIVEDVTYRREDSGFTVVDLLCEDEYVTVVGVLPEVSSGETLRLKGRWDVHNIYGKQFRVELCERSLPATAEDLLKYLSSGAIKGIGPVTAQKIIEKFGEDSFDVLENSPKRLATIRGISESKSLEIQKNFKEQFAVREVMIALERFGMTAAECLRVFKAFGANSVDNITRNPYVLCNEAIGIGFERADAIASAMPQSPPQDFRIEAGIIHVIRHNLSNGHTCVPLDKLLPLCASILEISEQSAELSIKNLSEKRLLVGENIDGRDFIFLPYMYIAERDAAEQIKIMLKFPPAGRETLEREIDEIERAEGISYEEKQRLAIKTAVEKGLLILTGGPGTGKTTALKGILSLFEKQGLDVALTAPTGRAAKRMSELTGREAKTIHRLLEVEWTDEDRPVFSRNRRNPIDAQAVIVDELSMVDSLLFSNLLDALKIGSRLIMVGDPDQLPAVGAGNVLHDLLESKVLPVVCLTEVFRQALESAIVTNAHKIVRGEKPELKSNKGDFFFLERNAESAPDTVTQLCISRLPSAYKYSPFDNIQIICPSRKGNTGTNNLNRLMQERLNPPSTDKKEINIRAHLFREGDKVMQIKNNYNIVWSKQGEDGTGIFNGDIGVLVRINMQESSLVVVFEDKTAAYSFEEAGELELAYAMTVHKSQGNEFNAVVMPVCGVVEPLRYRNLLYTAVTRAKNLLILVGESELVYEMAGNDKKSRRYTSLKHFLRKESTQL